LFTTEWRKEDVLVQCSVPGRRGGVGCRRSGGKGRSVRAFPMKDELEWIQKKPRDSGGRELREMASLLSSVA